MPIQAIEHAPVTWDEFEMALRIGTSQDVCSLLLHITKKGRHLHEPVRCLSTLQSSAPRQSTCVAHREPGQQLRDSHGYILPKNDSVKIRRQYSVYFYAEPSPVRVGFVDAFRLRYQTEFTRTTRVLAVTVLNKSAVRTTPASVKQRAGAILLWGGGSL